MANKNTIELYSDATIAQNGTQEEQTALRRELQTQIETWGDVYRERNIDNLWAQLGKINLGDQKIRSDIADFIANERKDNGGNAGSEFERRFAILERNMGLALAVDARNQDAKAKVTASATKEATEVKQDVSATAKPGAQKDIVRDSSENRSFEYSKKFLAANREAILKLKKDLVKPQSELLVLLSNAIENPDAMNVNLVQNAIKKINNSAIVSPLDSAKKGDPDGWFGPLTLKALQDLVKPPVAPTVTASSVNSPTSSAPFNKPSSGRANGSNTPASSPNKPTGVMPTSSKETLPDPVATNKVFYKDGAYYLTGPKGNPTRVEYGEILNRFGIPKEAGANLMQSSQNASNLAFLLEAYAQISPENQKNAQAAAKLLEEKMASTDVKSGKIIVPIGVEIFSLLKLDGVTRGAPIVGSKTKSLQDIFKSTIAPIDQRARLTQFVREEFKQYDLVANDIINRKWNGSIGAVSDAYFMKIATDLQGGNTYNTSPEYKILYDKIGATGMADVIKAIKKASAQASEDWEKNSKVYVEQFKKQTGYTGNIDATQLAKARDAYRASSIASVGKKEIMYQYLSKDAGLIGGKSKDAELKTLEGILGVGTLRMSDRAWDITGEAAQFLAIEALAIGVGVFTAGIGTAAINAAAFGRHAYRGTQALEAYNAASKTKQALVWSGRAVGGFGVGFEVGAGGVRSLHEGKNMYTKEGFAQSIAMGVVLGGLGSYFQSSKAPAFLKFKDGEGFLKNTIPFTSQVVIEGASMGLTAGAVGTYIFEKDHTWSPEEMGQAILMAALFKGVTRVKFSKGKDNEIIAEEVPPNTPTPEVPTRPVITEPLVPNAPRGSAMEAFTTREISGADVRRVRKQMKDNAELFPQFIANDGTVWSIRKISGSNGFEKLEIGPVGQPSLERLATIQEFVEGVNANVGKWKATTATPEATPTAPFVAPNTTPVAPVRAAAPEVVVAPPEAPTRPAPATPETVVTTSASVNFEKYLKNLESKLAKLKEGEKVSVGNATVTVKNGEYLHASATGEKVTFPKGAEGLKNLKKHVAESTPPEKMLQDSLSKDFNTKVESMIQKEIKVGDQFYRVVKNDAGGYVLQKKGANGGFAPVSEAEFARLNTAEIDTLLNSLLGKGTSNYFDAMLKNPFSAENPMMTKMKDVKLKEVFSEETLKKFPRPLQFLYNHTIGEIMKQLRHSLDLKAIPFSGDGLGKLEVIRTLYTGRSSHGNLWTNAHGGFGSILPSAWTPSLGTLAITGAITGAELYAENSDKISNTEDAINVAYDNKSEFVNNYFNYIWFGWLGTAVLEGAEVLELTKTAGDGLVAVGDDLVDRAGKDNVPDATGSYLDPVKKSISDAAKVSTDAAKEAYRAAEQKTKEILDNK